MNIWSYDHMFIWPWSLDSLIREPWVPKSLGSNFPPQSCLPASRAFLLEQTAYGRGWAQPLNIICACSTLVGRVGVKGAFNALAALRGWGVWVEHREPSKTKTLFLFFGSLVLRFDWLNVDVHQCLKWDVVERVLRVDCVKVLNDLLVWFECWCCW